MMRSILMPLLSLLVACAEANGSEPSSTASDAGRTNDAGKVSPPAGQAMCDGSNTMRFAYNNAGGGPIPIAETFLITYGFSGFFVDGGCHYYALSDAWEGAIVSGMLRASDAQQLSTEVGWDQLDSWRSYKELTGCPDAGGSYLYAPNASVGCVCGCDSQAPAGLTPALSAAERWRARLASAGTPLSGPLSAIAVPNDAASGKPVPWPLPRTMTTIPNLIFDANASKLGTGPYARFDDASETASLRALRTSADHGTWKSSALIADNGKNYDLYLRDELPDATSQAIKDLLGAGSQP